MIFCLCIITFIYDLNYPKSCVNMHLGSVWSAQETLYEVLIKFFLCSSIAFGDWAVLCGVNIIIKKETWKNMLNLYEIGWVLLYVHKSSLSFISSVFFCVIPGFSYCEQALRCDIIFFGTGTTLNVNHQKWWYI